MSASEPLFLTNPKDGTELVRIPGGEFWMGSEDGDKDAYGDEKPRHRHRVTPFYLGIYCVTVAQFRRFTAETNHDAGSDWKKDAGDHPVRYVNWQDAMAYAQWAGLRLPTEAEWELAARGYEGRKYPWGDDWEEGRRVCWDGQKGLQGETAPLDAHPEGAGPFGTFQQSGNVLEWCEDWYDNKAYQRYAKGDFSPPTKRVYRVLRGGSWNDYDPRYFRGAYRSSFFDPAYRSLRGFRLARTVTF